MKKEQQQKFSQSLVDFIMNTPGFGNKFSDHFARNDNASKLFKIWKNSSNQISPKVFKKTDVMSSRELEDMQQEGLIKVVGDKIQITTKGSEIIKMLILGDDRSAYEDDGKDIDIRTAKSNIEKVAKKRQEKAWWKRYIG